MDKITVQITDLDKIRDTYQLTEGEVDTAFQRARRRVIGAGRDRAYRQLKRLTGEGREFWFPNRVFAGADPITGAGRVWVGLNKVRIKNRRIRAFPNLGEFDGTEIHDAMLKIFDAELGKAAAKIVAKGP